LNELQLSQSAAHDGLPRQQQWNNPANWVHVIRNPGFVVGYSEIRRNPLWVAYKAEAIDKKRFMPRPDYFSTDYRSLVRVTQGDYNRSGYDRGHMAPNYLISQLYGRDAQLASFKMTNIVPQRPRLNRELWQRIEEVEADFFARWFKELWILTGPVFDDRRQFMPSGVEIPDGFFKIMLDIDRAGNPRVIAFLVPQAVRGNTPLEQLVVTVDQLESITGFDFFPDMPAAVETRLEASTPDHHWKLEQVGRMPSRYKLK
ncbi:MAG: DNA/RNA non-specific endonuclease, partial [Nevskiales bacterium]